MCTVSFIPYNGRIYLTSNRDEQQTRKPAQPPLKVQAGSKELLYPRDSEKGGTWIAADSAGNAAVLLNGAFKAHTPNPPYRQSRGIIILEVLAAAEPLQALHRFDAAGIEPFTLILYTNQRLFECRWDGATKSIRELNAHEPHLWSSATLYREEVVQKRESWFAQWLQRQKELTSDAILAFHRSAGDGDAENDLVMNRGGRLSTMSITGLELSQKCVAMRYTDLRTGKWYKQRTSLNGFRAAAPDSTFKRFWIRLRHWEYWPFHVVYAPIFVYWFWLCCKARSFFFFNTANPTIRNGGFLMESKKEIYDLLPSGSYPVTALVHKEAPTCSDPEAVAQLAGLNFPMIAKPDIGLRGMGVKLLRSVQDLLAYHASSKVDYLLQAFVPYRKEVGIFYYRIPGTPDGTITGVVGKEFLTVTGDGISSVEELLQQEPRFLLQLPALRKTHQIELTEVLAAGEAKLLVPYGNHSRGAKFVDLTHMVTPELSHTINVLCKQIKGFYFGRLDIKYDCWEDLCAGKNFSIIELNGSGSEPAHIYDPKHSLLFGWKEIIRHLNILYRISKHNNKVKRLPYLSLRQGLRLLRDNQAYVQKIS